MDHFAGLDVSVKENPNACPFSETTQAALVAYSATRSLRVGFPYRPAKLANWDETRQPHITSQP